MRATARPSRLHRSYCRDSSFDERLLRCGGCGTRCHEGCWDELGSCPTFGCSRGVVESSSDDGIRVELPPVRARGPRVPIWLQVAACLVSVFLVVAVPLHLI